MRNAQQSFHDQLGPPPIEAAAQQASYLFVLARHRADIAASRKNVRRAQMSEEERQVIKDRKKLMDAARYERDRDKIIDRVKSHYRKNRTMILAKAKSPENRRRYAVRIMLYSAAKRAVEKGLDFNLDFSDIQIPDVCPVLGIPLSSASVGKAMDCNPSLDRWNNDKGYVKGNVRVISLRANRLKSNATAEELAAVLAYMRTPPA